MAGYVATLADLTKSLGGPLVNAVIVNNTLKLRKIKPAAKLKFAVPFKFSEPMGFVPTVLLTRGSSRARFVEPILAFITIN